MSYPKWGGGGHFWVSDGFESEFVGRRILGVGTMIYDVFRVTQLQRLPLRLGKGCLIVLNEVKVI